jgi:hypothetical protein
MLNKLKPKSEFSSNVLTFIIDSISLNTDLFTEVDELMVFLRKQHLSKLKEENKIKRVGSTKSGYWKILL